MKKNLRHIICVICHVLLCIMALVNSSEEGERKPYIVYMGDLPENNEATSFMDEHHNILTNVMGSEQVARESKIHSYGKSFNAFAAHLYPHEAEKLKEKKNIISVFPDTTYKLVTTHSWDFVGMPLTVKRIPQVESDTIVAILDTEKKNIISIFPDTTNKLVTTDSWDFVGMTLTVKRSPQVESDIIVAILDSGIYVDSPTFDGKGFGPPPKKWKGTCEKGANFTGCNNKVIGAQTFNIVNSTKVRDNDRSPTDNIGHGTHCASIAAGNAVPGTSVFGIAEGTARGGVPSARLAIYKICFLPVGCDQINMLAGFDKAIYDGVDVISLSATTRAENLNFFEDGVAIGAFHAQKKGISVVAAAGNSGPEFYTLFNTAPWLTTVGANGDDRMIQTQAKLGNGKVYYGTSVNTFHPGNQMYPLTNGVLAKNGNNTKDGDSSACKSETLNEEKVKGAIVHCVGKTDGGTISDLHATGHISSDDTQDNGWAGMMGLPGLVVNKSEGESIDQYITSTKSPTAVIYKSVVINKTTPAPDIPSFSSRGPQLVSINILKPDVVAPGVNILGGNSELNTLSGEPGDKRFSKYTIMSGTSMATPHVTGVTTYVKGFHPEWSPAAIKSALMTTAKPLKVKPIEGALASGAGMINPTEALNPGLIYDINLDSYISFLCKEGYNSTTLSILTGSSSYDCSKVQPAKGTDGLNYPSMHLQLQKRNSSSFSAVFYRTVTNVGEGVSLYKANIESPKELSVSVVPKMLSFTKPNQALSFRVDVNGKFESETSRTLEASLVWSDSSNHNVRSPILVFRNTTSAPQ